MSTAVAAPKDGWETKPAAGKSLLYVNSKLTSITVSQFPKTSDEENGAAKILVHQNDVFLRATLRMIGWALSRVDIMEKLLDSGKVSKASYDDFSDRLTEIYTSAEASGSYTDDELTWAWLNRSAQASFKPPFDHYRKKFLGKEKP